LLCLLYTVPSVPQNPNVLTIVGLPTELLVTWDPPAEQNGIILLYTVYCYELSMEENHTFANAIASQPAYREVPGNETYAVLVNLIPYSLYGCRVSANTSVGEGNFSSTQFNITDESGKYFNFSFHNLWGFYFLFIYYFFFLANYAGEPVLFLNYTH